MKWSRDLFSQNERRGWDSNPRGLAPAGFQDVNRTVAARIPWLAAAPYGMAL